MRSKKKLVHWWRSSVDGMRNYATWGEAFADGTMIELIRDSATGQLNLVFWDGEKATISPRVEYNGRVYVPTDPGPSILQALTFPTHCAPYGSTRELLTGLCALAARYNLPEETACRLAHFVLATWFPECLPVGPCLLTVGPSPEATLVLELLGCVVRRPLPLAEVDRAGLCCLPMDLKPTLLISQSELSSSARRLLGASNKRNAYVPRKGGLLNLYCAKAIYLGKHLGDASFTEGAIQITVAPTLRSLPVLDEETKQKIANEFQSELLMYRVMNYAKVRDSQFDAPGLTSSIRILARSFGACIIDDPELQANIVPLLEDQDQQIRAERLASLESIVIEALLFCCHDGERSTVRVAELASVANLILEGRGESLRVEPESVGWRLKSLGLFTRKIGSAGKGLLLLDDTRRRIHQLARDYEVPAIQSGGKHGCRHCAHLGGPSCDEAA